MGRPSAERIEKLASMIMTGMTVDMVTAAEGLKEDSIRRYMDWAELDGVLPSNIAIVGNSFVNSETGERIAVEKGRLEKVDKRVDDKGMCITTTSSDIDSVEDALIRAGVDLSIWEVEKSTVSSREIETKKWEFEEFGEPTGPLFTVKVWLKKKKLNIAAAVKSIEDAFKGNVKAFVPTEKPWRDSGVMCEIEFPDLHIGKYASKNQTGTENNKEIAMAAFEKATDELLSYASLFKPELILVPLGNDLMHIDNLVRTTTKGTPQDADGIYQDIYEFALEGVIRFINKARQIANVHILVIPGNHDELSSFHMGAALRGRYHDTEDVFIDNGATSRKYFRWGCSLLGFVHGGKGDPSPDTLPMLMATEKPKDWGATTHREWHLGHEHRGKAIKWLTTNSELGVVLRVLPSLTSADYWHFKHGFVEQKRVAEMYIWSRKDGFVGMFSSTPIKD